MDQPVTFNDVEIKEEPFEEVESSAKDLHLYANHKIEGEMAIGPTVLQSALPARSYNDPSKLQIDVKCIEQSKTHKIKLNTNMEESFMCNNEIIKQEPSEDVVRATEELDLYADHEIKEEICIGPTVLRRAPYDSDLKRSDENSQSTEDKFESGIASQKLENGYEKLTNNDGHSFYHFCKPFRSKHEEKHASKILLECNFCSRKLESNHVLNRHMRTHTGERPFECNFCHKTFLCSSSRNRHMRTHTGEKPFECNFCDKKFVSSCNLNRHTRFHTGERPFLCNMCDKKFTEKSKLVSHMRTHTGEKPFKCNVCAKMFTEKSKLILHIRIHTGEKMFKCNFCNKKFLSSSDLNRHMRIHTGEKPFKCNVCDKKFTQNSNLIIHMRTHNG